MEKRNLRSLMLTGVASMVETMGLCEIVFQGDLSNKQSTGSGVFSDQGAQPTQLYGPLPAATATGSGLIFPGMKLGMTVNGDSGSEFIFCKLVLAGTTDLLPGQGYFWDKDFLCQIMSATNATNILNAEVGIASVWSPNTIAGTYFIWLQRAGHAAIQAIAGSLATGSGETSATAGAFKFPTSPTAGQKNALPLTAFNSSSGITFTGNTVNGSPTIANIVSVSGGTADPLRDITPGMVITGTNLPANAIVINIRKTGNTWAADIGTNSGGSYPTLQNATGTAAGTTFTVTSHVVGNIFWPTFSKQN